MLTAISVVFAVNVLTSFLKKFVFKKLGSGGVQITVFVLALIGALYMTYAGQFPTIKVWIESALGIFSFAVALYEVILNRIPAFRGKPRSLSEPK